VNGDGYPGFGPAFDRNNDLLYVPELLSEVPLTGLASTALLGSAIATEPCLAAHVGTTMGRNACRAPWRNRLDVRISQTVPLGPADVRIEADLINVLNFLSSDWGLVRETRSTIPVLELHDRDPFTQVLHANWAGGITTSLTEDGEVTGLDPFVNSSPESQWQAQIGLKVTWR